jgi:hypothetical protein
LFVTSQGSAHGRFTPAIKQRNIFNAEIAMRELGSVSLLIPVLKEKPAPFQLRRRQRGRRGGREHRSHRARV